MPILGFLTNKRIDHITIENDEIISLIRKINPNKATGSDGISGQMLLLCDESIILPLQIIFTNILTTSIYPDMWKIANVTPIFKKGDKQLIKNFFVSGGFVEINPEKCIVLAETVNEMSELDKSTIENVIAQTKLSHNRPDKLKVIKLNRKENNVLQLHNK